MRPKQLREPTFKGGDWVSHNVPTWRRAFAEHLGRPIRMLEIGTYEGRSAIWFLDNLLVHSDSHLTTVDSFADDSPEFTSRGVVETRARKNLEPYGARVCIIKNHSTLAMAHMLSGSTSCFDIIYVDGGHWADQALSDGVMAFHLLKFRGLIAFDDYKWSSDRTTHPPKDGIDGFVKAFSRRIEVVERGYQVIVRKLR